MAAIAESPPLVVIDDDDDNNNDTAEVDEMEEGDEPGACSEHYLVAVEPLEDLGLSANNVQDANGTVAGEKKRHGSMSTIKQIKKEIRKQRSSSTSSGRVATLKNRRDSFASSDEAGGNSSASANVSETESDGDLGHSIEPENMNDSVVVSTVIHRSINR